MKKVFEILRYELRLSDWILMVTAAIISALILFVPWQEAFLDAIGIGGIEVSAKEVSEVSEETSSEILEKKSSEVSEEESSEVSEEESSEVSEEESSEVSEEESSEVSEKAIEISDEDFELFCHISYAEAGGESTECIIATMWEIKNGAMERHNGDFKSEIFYPNRYEPVQEDGTIICGEGVVTDDLITDEFRSLARKVICGEIEDPTNGALCFLGYEALGYDDPDEFAKKFAIEKYIVIGRHIFFYEWTEELNNL